MQVNWPKVVVAVALLACVTVLMALGTMPSDVGTPILISVGTWIFANGVTSLQGVVPSPLIAPSLERLAASSSSTTTTTIATPAKPETGESVP